MSWNLAPKKMRTSFWAGVEALNTRNSQNVLAYLLGPRARGREDRPGVVRDPPAALEVHAPQLRTPSGCYFSPPFRGITSYHSNVSLRAKRELAR